MTTDLEIIVWQLARIHSAAETYRDRSGKPVQTVEFWEPGSIWSASDPALSMDFAAFQIGVAVREIGGLPFLTAIVSALAEASGGPAARWLAGIWADLQPDQEFRSQFLMLYEMNGTDTQ